MELDEGVLLIPEHSQFPRVSFLTTERLQTYNKKIATYGERARKTLIDVFSSAEDKRVYGSQAFGNVVIASDILAFPSQLEHAARLNPKYFEHMYTDFGLVQRTREDSYRRTDFVAKHLAEQIKKRIGAYPSPEKPVRISFRGVSVQKHRNSAYGLVFLIGDETEVIRIPEFSYENNGRKFSRTDERGVPIWDERGKRKFYARADGLSRLSLGKDLNLDTGTGGWTFSNKLGRVVVIQNDEIDGKIKKYEEILRIMRDKEDCKDTSKHTKARKILLGK